MGHTEQYSTKDIDELANLLSTSSVKPQEEIILPESIQEMLLEYELAEEMKKHEQSLEEQLQAMQVSQKPRAPPSKRVRR